MSTLVNVTIAAGFMSGLGVALASVLAVANRKLLSMRTHASKKLRRCCPALTVVLVAQPVAAP